MSKTRRTDFFHLIRQRTAGARFRPDVASLTAGLLSLVSGNGTAAAQIGEPRRRRSTSVENPTGHRPESRPNGSADRGASTDPKAA